MSLTDAEARVAERPELALYVRPPWLQTEAQKAAHEWHPMYDWLQAPNPESAADSFADALDSALADGVGDVATRGRRLTGGDVSDYWSAMCELYLAAALIDCGLAARLDNPDVVVADSADVVAIELNAVQATSDTHRLTAMLASAWEGELQGVIEVPDETVRITRFEAEAVVELMLAAERGHRSVLDDAPESLSIPVDLSPAFQRERDRVRGFLEAGDPGFLITRSGVRNRILDPWPGLEQRVLDKRQQLSNQPCGIVAVEHGHGHVTAYSWADRVLGGYDVPVLTTDPNIAGLLVYWLDLRRHLPFKALYFTNSEWHGESSFVDGVIHALGARDVGQPPYRGGIGHA